MRLRIPPFLPPYLLLFLVIAYACGALWLGLSRLDAITRLIDSSTRNGATVHDLDSLQIAVSDIESGARGFVLTGDDAYLEPFERGRRLVPALLSTLRDDMRDNSVELGLIETLVPLVSERTTISAAAIEKKRSAPDVPYERNFGGRGKETSEGIRTIVAKLTSIEEDQLYQARETLERTVGEARRDLYIMAAMTLLLVISLFLAVRRLKSFMLFVPGSITEAAVDLPARPPGTEVDALMRDAILRLELAPTASSAEGGEGAGGRTTIDALEKALSSHEQAEEPEARGASRGLSRAMATLSELYSRADGLTIKSTIDQSAKVTDARNSFLLLRSAEWVLEAITLRKRAGEVTLQLSASGHDVVLRIHALVDNSNLPIVLAPRESEQANVLQQGVLARGGSFIVAMGPTGFSLTLTLPIDS